jgi:hypothetical protein
MFFSFPFPASLTLALVVGRFTKATLAGVAVFLGAAATRAETEPPALLVRCSRLDQAASEELAARVHLLFAERGLEPSGIELRCTSANAWVVWGDEHLPVERSRRLSDAFLDAVDARLALVYRELPAEAEAESSNLEGVTPSGTAGADASDHTLGFSLPPPTPAEAPQFDRPLRLPPAYKRWPELYRPEGGLSLGVDIDSSHGDLDASWGPRLEVGLPIGMFTVMGAETARFGSSSERTTMNLGAEVGVGFGAPYARGAPLGLALRAFSDWLIGYTRDATIAQTFWSPGVALGLRAALDAPLVPWVGIDGRLRLVPLDLGDNDSAPLPQLTAVVTVGIAYLADGPRPFSPPQTKRALVAQGSSPFALGPEATEPDFSQTP